jgi:hydrogenase maturation protease
MVDESTPAGTTTLVLGVGNPLMSDDGVGQQLLAALASIEPPLEGVDYVDAGTLSLMLLPRIEACASLLVLDAARFGEGAGVVRALRGPEMDAFLATARCSVHEVGLRDLLDAARLTGALPPQRALVGVEPAKVDWGAALSPAVAAAVGPAARLARALLEDWRRAITG